MRAFSAFASVLNAILIVVFSATLAVAEPSIDLPEADTQPAGAPVTFTLRDLDPSVAYWVTLVPVGTAIGKWAEYSYIKDASVAEVTLPGVEAGDYELRLHDQASGYPLYATLPVTILDAAKTGQTGPEITPVIEVANAEALRDGAPVAVALRDLDPSKTYWVTLVPDTTPVGQWAEYADIGSTEATEVTFEGVAAGTYEIRLHGQADGYPLYTSVALTVVDDSVSADWEDMIGHYAGNVNVDYLGYVDLNLTIADGGALLEYAVRRRSCKTWLHPSDEAGFRKAEPYSVRNACYGQVQVAVERMSADAVTFAFQIDEHSFSAKLPRVLGPVQGAIEPQQQPHDLRGFTPQMTGAAFEQLATELGYSIVPNASVPPKLIRGQGGRAHLVLSAYKTDDGDPTSLRSQRLTREDIATEALIFVLQSHEPNEFRAGLADALANAEEQTAEATALIIKEHMDRLKQAQGLFVVRWQSFLPEVQPSGARVDGRLKEKYGEPSIFAPANRMPDGGKYEWHTDISTGLAHATPQACSIARRNGIGTLQVLAPKRMVGLPGGMLWDATAYVSAQPSCGISVYADLATDQLGLATKLTMMSIDHGAYLNEQWLQAEALVLGTVAEITRVQQEAAGIEPDL